MNKQKQKEFIIKYVKDNCCVSALDQKFHEEFYNKFKGKRHECYFGARTVYKAMRTIKELYKSNILERKLIGLSNWQPGFPKWCYTYHISKQI